MLNVLTLGWLIIFRWSWYMICLHTLLMICTLICLEGFRDARETGFDTFEYTLYVSPFSYGYFYLVSPFSVVCWDFVQFVCRYIVWYVMFCLISLFVWVVVWVQIDLSSILWVYMCKVLTLVCVVLYANCSIYDSTPCVGLLNTWCTLINKSLRNQTAR